MTSLPELGSLVGDKYRVERLLGVGGMGAVFGAQHLLMERAVALKWLRPELASHPEARDRFMREARAAARIHHPNVVDVYDAGVHQGSLFMVMELLEGEHLEELMRRGDVPTASILKLLVGAMHGVSAAHRHGIVHRDIKPENLFVVRPSASFGPLVKVLDFGISKLLDEPHRDTHLTQAGAPVGTPLFMSFEQLSGARDVDARADVYSFGVLLYRALTGIIPFDAESVAAIAVLIATYRPPAPAQIRPEIPAELSRVVMKAMAFDREDRYRSMDELIGALTSVEARDSLLARCIEPRHRIALRAGGDDGLAPFDVAAPTGPAGSLLPSGTPVWLRLGGAAACLALALVAGLWLLLAAQPAPSASTARRADPAPTAGEAHPLIEARPALTPPPVATGTAPSAPVASTPTLKGATKPPLKRVVVKQSALRASGATRALLRRPDF